MVHVHEVWASLGRSSLVDSRSETASLEAAVSRIRENQLQRVLEETGGSVARAAEIFGVHRSTVYRWIRNRQMI